MIHTNLQTQHISISIFCLEQRFPLFSFPSSILPSTLHIFENCLLLSQSLFPSFCLVSVVAIISVFSSYPIPPFSHFPSPLFLSMAEQTFHGMESM